MKKKLSSAGADILLESAEQAAEQDKEQPRLNKTTDSGEKRNRKETTLFSCRVDSDTVTKWKAYANAGGYGKIGELTGDAMQEYIKNHRLSREQKQKYNDELESRKL